MTNEYVVIDGKRYAAVAGVGAETAGGASAGLVVVDGLANNAVRVSAVVYNENTILGFRIINVGTGDLILTPNTAGATDITITAAELTLMGANAYVDFPIACSEVSVGAAMELLVYI